MRISGITFATRRKRSKAKVFIKIFLIALIILIIGLMGYLSYVGWALTHPSRKAVTVTAVTSLPGFENVSFQDRKKSVKLQGWYYNSPGSDKTIILCHGYKDNRLQFKPPMLQQFINGGYNVLTFDFRNCGKSGGSVTSVGCYEKYDLLGAIDFVKKNYTKKISVMGWSMGASTAIVATAEDKDVDALIADSPFSDLNSYLNSQLPVWSHMPPKWTHLPSTPFNKVILLAARLFTGMNPSNVSPKKVIAKIAPRPLLLIHSRDDDAISVKNSIELYNIYSKAAGSNADFWETSGVGHVGTYGKYPDKYMTRVLGFLNSVYR